MLEETGCDGLMIGRAAQGNPWIFKNVTTYLAGGIIPPKPDMKQIKEMILRHAELLIAHKGTYIGMREMRKHAAWYTAGHPNSSKLRRSLSEIETIEDLKQILSHIG